MLFKAVGKEPNYYFAPLWLFDVIIDGLQWVADTFNSEKFENAAEIAQCQVRHLFNKSISLTFLAKNSKEEW